MHIWFAGKDGSATIARRTAAVVLASVILATVSHSTPPAHAEVAFYLPYTAGTAQTITQGPGDTRSHADRYNRYAVDFAMPSGTPVRASADGNVVFSGWDTTGYGFTLLVDHGDDRCTQYAHNSRVHVGRGPVRRGQLIASSGSTGRSTGPHLHWGLVSCTTRASLPLSTVETGNTFRPGTRPLSRNAPHPGREVRVVDDAATWGPAHYLRRRTGIGWNADMVSTYSEGDGARPVNGAEWVTALNGGRYEVSVFVPRDHATAVVRYFVRHNGGQSAVVIDQRRHYDAWVTLGTFTISGGRASVGINDATGPRGAVIGIDAVRWTATG